MLETNVKKCLFVWRRKYGEEKIAKAQGNTYWRIPIQNRRYLVIVFLRWMRALGHGEERFKQSSFQKDLIDFCFGKAPAFDEKKRERGHEALKEELEDILATEGIFSGKRPKKHKKVFNAIKSASNIDSMAEKALDNAFSNNDILKEPKTLGREINRDMYKNVSNYEPILDEEFAALIGVKKDE